MPQQIPLDDIHNWAEKNDSDYAQAVQEDPEVARQYLEYLRKQFDTTMPVDQLKALPDTREVSTPLFASAQHTEPKPAVSGPVKSTDKRASQEGSMEEPLFTKQVEAAGNLSAEEEKRLHDLERLGGNWTPKQKLEYESLAKRVYGAPEDVFKAQQEHEVNTLPLRRPEPPLFQVPPVERKRGPLDEGNPFDVPFTDNPNETNPSNAKNRILTPDENGVIHVAPAPETPGDPDKGPNKLVPETPGDPDKPQPQTAQPQPLFAQQPATEPQPERGMGRIDITGFDHTPVQPEPPVSVQPLFKQQEAEQAPAAARPVVAQGIERQPTTAEAQQAKYDEPVNAVNRLNRALEKLWAGSGAPAVQGLPQATVQQSRRRSEHTEAVLDQAGLSEHAKTVLRSLDLQDDELEALVSKISGTKQNVKRVQQAVRSINS